MTINYFIHNNFDYEIGENKFNQSNEEKILDEWKRICIYILHSIGYSFTFTKDSSNYLNILNQNRMTNE